MGHSCSLEGAVKILALALGLEGTTPENVRKRPCTSGNVVVSSDNLLLEPGDSKPDNNP